MITSKEILKLARELLCDSEVKNRAAIGRAYYASYHAIKNLAKVKLGYHAPEKGDRQSVHWHLCQFLISHSEESIQVIGCELRKLSRNRRKADYQLNATIEKNNSTLIVAMASSIIDDSKKSFIALDTDSSDQQMDA